MKDATRAVHHLAVGDEGYAALTVPTHRASTIVFPDAQAYTARSQRGPDGYVYGMHGTPTQRTLEAQLTALEGGLRSVVLPSGQAAIAVIMLAALRTGDHVLIAETAYPPAAAFCTDFLVPHGITHSTYPPGIGAGIAERVTDATRLIWMESPGSTTMEVEDVPGIVGVARSRGIPTGIDNTWATPLLFKPLSHGVDFSMQALTKYPGGHSDVLMGAVTVNDLELHRRLHDQMRLLGMHTAPDAVSLVLRGLETMPVRLAHVGRVATEIAAELDARLDTEVLFPALPTSPGHALWRRDFAGSAGLFSIVVPDAWQPRLDEALDGLETFAIGASWGGTRSLVAPMSIASHRDTPHPRNERTILRVSIGLEDPADLRADLDRLVAVLVG